MAEEGTIQYGNQNSAQDYGKKDGGITQVRQCK
jgi:hypothetical protein